MTRKISLHVFTVLLHGNVHSYWADRKFRAVCNAVTSLVGPLNLSSAPPTGVRVNAAMWTLVYERLDLSAWSVGEWKRVVQQVRSAWDLVNCDLTLLELAGQQGVELSRLHFGATCKGDLYRMRARIGFLRELVTGIESRALPLPLENFWAMALSSSEIASLCFAARDFWDATKPDFVLPGFTPQAGLPLSWVFGMAVCDCYNQIERASALPTGVSVRNP